MTKHLRILSVMTACLLMYACTKHDMTSPSGTRLVKVRTNMADSSGNDCATCYVTELFAYDALGKLVTITDSGGRGLPTSGPWPFMLNYNYYHTLQYNDQGNLIKSGRDSFLYNSNNQLIQRLRRIPLDTSRYWLINTYVYDNKGRLITDTSFTGQTSLHPSIIPAQISSFSYDANDNLIKIDNNSVWPVGTSTHQVYTSGYDNKINPFKNLGIIPYLAFNTPFLLSSNNPQTQDYQYEYYSNGLLKKVSYKSVIQEYIYE